MNVRYHLVRNANATERKSRKIEQQMNDLNRGKKKRFYALRKF
jgi:hypothetical protein